MRGLKIYEVNPRYIKYIYLMYRNTFSFPKEINLEENTLVSFWK